MDGSGRQALPYGVMGVELVKLLLEQEKAGIGCFSRVHFRKRMVVVYYSEKLVHANIYGDKELESMGRNVIMSVSVKKFICTPHKSRIMWRTLMRGFVKLG